MNSFVFFSRLSCAGFALLVTLSVPAASQDRNSPGATSLSNANPTNQSRGNPSFDCRAARSSIERAICGDVTLSEWDSRMGQLFQQALRLAKDRQALLQNQRLWLTQRDSTCGAVADTAIWSCLLETTKSRAAKIATSNIEATQTVQPPPAVNVPTTPQATPQVRAQSPLSESPGDASPSTTLTSQNKPSPSTSPGDNSFVTIILLFLFILALAIALKLLSAVRREQRLVEKYGAEIAAQIIAQKVWQGMTEEQLTESWGDPAGVGREIIRTKIKETWKYNQTGKNRFSNRVYLENGIVIGWKN
jgi:uncharacterized protein